MPTASNIASTRELVKTRETGQLFEVGNEQDLAAKILEVLKSRNRYHAMCSASFDVARNSFDMKAIAVKLEQIYQEAIDTCTSQFLSDTGYSRL